MKQHDNYFQNLNLNITFYIGENAQDNFDIIDKCDENDLWFHSKDQSSCHVVAIISDNIKQIKKQKMHSIIHYGALLCKQNTNKLVKQSNVEIIYTKIKNIQKTNVVGCVNATNLKEMIV